MDVASIRTERLELISFRPDVMRAVVDSDLVEAGRRLGAAFPATVAGELRDFFRVRIADLDADPDRQPWLARAIVLDAADGRLVAGSVGFHGPPDAEGRAEVGYQIQPPFRRRGFTTEAVRGLFDWAATTHGIDRFRASIASSNDASIGLVTGLGFVPVGVHHDEIDGEELVYEVDGWRPRGGI